MHTDIVDKSDFKKPVAPAFGWRVPDLTKLSHKMNHVVPDDNFCLEQYLIKYFVIKCITLNA